MEKHQIIQETTVHVDSKECTETLASYRRVGFALLLAGVLIALSIAFCVLYLKRFGNDSSLWIVFESAFVGCGSGACMIETGRAAYSLHADSSHIRRAASRYVIMIFADCFVSLILLVTTVDLIAYLGKVHDGSLGKLMILPALILMLSLTLMACTCYGAYRCGAQFPIKWTFKTLEDGVNDQVHSDELTTGGDDSSSLRILRKHLDMFIRNVALAAFEIMTGPLEVKKCNLREQSGSFRTAGLMRSNSSVSSQTSIRAKNTEIRSFLCNKVNPARELNCYSSGDYKTGGTRSNAINEESILSKPVRTARTINSSGTFATAVEEQCKNTLHFRESVMKAKNETSAPMSACSNVPVEKHGYTDSTKVHIKMTNNFRKSVSFPEDRPSHEDYPFRKNPFESDINAYAGGKHPSGSNAPLYSSGGNPFEEGFSSEHPDVCILTKVHSSAISSEQGTRQTLEDYPRTLNPFEGDIQPLLNPFDDGSTTNPIKEHIIVKGLSSAGLKHAGSRSKLPCQDYPPRLNPFEDDSSQLCNLFENNSEAMRPEFTKE